MVNKVAKTQAERPVRGHHSKTDEEYFVLSRDDIKWRWEKVVRLYTYFRGTANRIY